MVMCLEECIDVDITALIVDLNAKILYISRIRSGEESMVMMFYNLDSCAN